MDSILLAVSGLRPQIFTETLYALHREGHFPSRAVLLTTQQGAKLAREFLLGSDGQIAAFLRDYGLPANANPLSKENILIPSCKGRLLEDITTREESEAFQELAMRQAWRWTQDRGILVDFSIAGGRKTMSASLALAAQCYGRPQDRLFHVLAAPHCEEDMGFFYPRPGVKANTHIILAPVPFPRLRSHLPESLLCLPATPQDLLRSFHSSAASRVRIHCTERRVSVNGSGCTLPPVLFALFLWFAVHKRNFACNGQCDTCDRQPCFMESSSLLSAAAEIARMYRMVSPSAATSSTTGILDLNQENFLAYKAKLNRNLRRNLGDLAEQVVIVAQGRRPKVRYGIFARQSSIQIEKTDGNIAVHHVALRQGR